MSNPEHFIEEVTEEVRRDRLFTLFRRYGWIAILAVLLLVGGATYNEWRKASDRAAAQALGDTLLQAMDGADAGARVAALEAAVSTDTLDAKPLIDLLAASEETTGGLDDAARARLQAMADNTTVPSLYRQLATLKLILLDGSARPADDRRAALQPLAEPNAPFRPLALEQLALLDIEAGQTEAALAGLRQLLELPETTAGLRQRATQLIVALGGTLDGA